MADDKFYWHRAVIFINSQEESTRQLKGLIDRYGINGRDAFYTTIFDSIHNSPYYKDLVDILFEYNPTFPTLSEGYFEINPCLLIHDGYILSKFLERDTEYQLIRCRYRPKYSSKHILPNFMCYYYSDMFEYSRRIAMFVNHFHRGITFFELMKFRTIDDKKK